MRIITPATDANLKFYAETSAISEFVIIWLSVDVPSIGKLRAQGMLL
jgi:hypothetical protein